MTTSVPTSTAKTEARAHAPGKLILSGEHSVLYGGPALAMAIAQYTEVTFTPQGPGEGVRTAFENLSTGAHYPFKLLSRFKSSLDKRFDQFTRGELAVHKILTRPDDLAIYTLASLLQDGPTGTDLPGLGAVNQLPYPGQLSSCSSLPIGAGMGSSAAVVAAVTVLFEVLLNRHKTPEERYERVRFCERLKHGKAGPIDAAAVVHGGLVRVSDGGFDVPQIAPDHGLLNGDGWFWVLHGRPQSTTGECVSHVREHHGQDVALWDDFAACTGGIIADLESGADPRDGIRENQRLLERIGVVPEPAQSFVRAVEAAGGVAKTCGAGSVRGDQGGAILVRMDSDMEQFMTAHQNLQWGRLRLAPTGAAVGPAP